jgi:hypothetical protein
MKTSFLSSFLLSAVIAAGPVGAKDTPPVSDGDLELAHRLENAFEKVAAQTSESVVVISTKTKFSAKADTGDEEGDGSEQFKGTPFEYFFRRHHGPMQQQPP